jgi:hypothetical protein
MVIFFELLAEDDGDQNPEASDQKLACFLASHHPLLTELRARRVSLLPSAEVGQAALGLQ